MPPSPSPSPSPAAPSVSARARRSTLRRLLKWFVWSAGILMLLITLFLTLPGFTCVWQFPKMASSTERWIFLRRQKRAGYDIRSVELAWFRVDLVFYHDGHLPEGPGARWIPDGRFVYSGDQWQLFVGKQH